RGSGAAALQAPPSRGELDPDRARMAVAGGEPRPLRRHGVRPGGRAAATGDVMSTPAPRKGVRILGTRGIPNRHGGFEACAEHLAPWLVERGWDVTVYCQEPWGQPLRRSTWRGVTLEHLPTRLEGSAGSVAFDLASARHAAAH